MKYEFSSEKNDYLKTTRNVSFEEIITGIESGGLLDEGPHPNSDIYPHQRMFYVGMNEYVYRVPYVFDGTTYFLKTIYPSRVATKKYLSH